MANPAATISQRDDAVAINGTTIDQRGQSRAVSDDGLTSSDRLTSDNRLPSDTSTDAGDGSQMTVAQMLKIYAKDAVESALFEQDYTEARQREIDVLKAQIQQGMNAVSCQEGLDLIEKTSPPGRPIDPQEPQDLHPDVLWRIQCLKYMHDNLDHSPEQSKNLKAILQEYRSKHLNVIKGHVTLFFFAGIRKLGPIKEEEASPDFLMDKIKQWSAEHEGGQITVEQLLENHAKLLATTLSCFNISSHPMFTLLVRLEGQANFIEVPRVLDDTGSAFLILEWACATSTISTLLLLLGLVLLIHHSS